jgi:prophage antirepressor-like protein
MKFFDFKGNKFTTLTTKKGEPWLVAKEICEYLEILSPKKAVKRLPPLWRKNIFIPELASGGR